MAIWYRVSKRFGWDIEEFEAEGETDKFLLIGKNKRRISKENNYYIYLKTRSEAKAFLINRAYEQIAKANSLIGESKTALDKLENDL